MATFHTRLIATDELQDVERPSGTLNCRGVCLALVMAWFASRLTNFATPHSVPAFSIPSYVRGSATTSIKPAFMTDNGARIVPGDWEMNIELGDHALAPANFAAQRVISTSTSPNDSEEKSCPKPDDCLAIDRESVTCYYYGDTTVLKPDSTLIGLPCESFDQSSCYGPGHCKKVKGLLLTPLR